MFSGQCSAGVERRPPRPLQGYRCGAAVAEGGVGGALADGAAVAPAAFAFGGVGFGDGGGVGRDGRDARAPWGAGFEFEFAQDEDFFELGQAGGPMYALVGIGEVQGDGGFEVVGDDFSARAFSRAWETMLRSSSRRVAFGEGGGVGDAWRREELGVDGFAGAEVAPGFFRGEGEDGGEEAGKGREDLVQGGLGGAAASALRGVAIQAVLGDVDVEAAQVDGAELIEGVVDAVEFEFFVGLAAGLSTSARRARIQRSIAVGSVGAAAS